MPQRLQRGRKYLQIALNSNLFEAGQIISSLPSDARILLEAGTPLIKAEGISSVSHLRSYWLTKGLNFGLASQPSWLNMSAEEAQPDAEAIMLKAGVEKLNAFIPSWLKNSLMTKQPQVIAGPNVAAIAPMKKDLAAPYIVADLKTADLASWEVMMAEEAGASAVTCLGVAPLETINSFIAECQKNSIDSMVDMMNVKNPLLVLEELTVPPNVVILHRGVDEEAFNREKELPYHDIQLIKNKYDILIAVAGGDDFREVQRAIFNDADIVVVWKSFFAPSEETANLATRFLQEIR